MGKVIAAMNMTLDGVCDHTVGIVDEKLHQHYSDLINSAEVIMYGRTTFELMKFWQTLLINPSEEKSMNDFAISIDRIKKVVFSKTLNDTGWDTAVIAKRSLQEELLELKKRSGQDILVGSRSLIIQLLNSHLIDEFQICIHPLIEGKGLHLFDDINGRKSFTFIRNKTLPSGVTILYYEPTQRDTN